MRITLVVPGLAAALRADAPLPRALQRLASLGTTRTLEHGLDTATLQAVGLPAAVAVAPVAALGAGFDAGSAYVLRADPLALVAGRDDVLVRGRVDDLSPAHVEALRTALDAHFGTDGLAFHAPRPDAWFVTATSNVPVHTTPLRALRGPLQPFLPGGEHGRIWRRWLSEMQMLLHAHPLNAQRETAGQVPVTGLWIADGGTLPRDMAAAPLAVWASAMPEGDVARGIALLRGATARPLPAGWSALALTAAAPAMDTLIVADPVGDADSLARAERDWVDPAVHALERGEVTALTLLADGDGRAQAWTGAPPSFLGRWRARLRGSGA